MNRDLASLLVEQNAVILQKLANLEADLTGLRGDLAVVISAQHDNKKKLDGSRSSRKNWQSGSQKLRAACEQMNHDGRPY